MGKGNFLAAKSGVPDPEMNQSLKRAIERAKRINVQPMSLSVQSQRLQE